MEMLQSNCTNVYFILVKIKNSRQDYDVVLNVPAHSSDNLGSRNSTSVRQISIESTKFGGP